jgi:hypothetical protein
MVAAALALSWRPTPPAPELSGDDLSGIAPLVCDAGSAGLVWRRIRGSPLEATPAAAEIQGLYRSSVLLSALNETGIKKALPVLRRAGIEPLLIKGWAIARHYPERGLRPYSDLDLVVPAEQYERALATLREGFDIQRHLVDVHAGCADLDDRPLEEVYARSRLVKLGDVDVRVPSPEDHLRVLCIHMLRHGARRPMWACDVGVALETRPPDFDWDLCLGADGTKADWVACAIGIAHRLLGARVEDTPVAGRAARLPRWLLPAVLRGWGRPLGDTQSVPAHVSLFAAPAAFSAQFRARWDRPIQATVELGAPFNDLPRLPFQLASAVRRFPRLGRYATAIARS